MIEVDLEQYDDSIDKKLDVVIQKEDEIIGDIASEHDVTRAILKESINSDFEMPLNELILRQSLSDENLWYFSTLQMGFPKALNIYCMLNSQELLEMKSYTEIITSPAAMQLISNSRLATSICVSNSVLANALKLVLSNNKILAYGLGYKFFNEGEEFELTMKNNTKQFFRVVGVNVDGVNNITCRNTNTWQMKIRCPSYSNYTDYLSSPFRQTVNSWLDLFDDDISANMIPVSKKFGKILSSTDVSYGEVNDKLWLYACSELTLSKDITNSTSALDEGKSYSLQGLGKMNFYSDTSNVQPQSMLRSISRYQGNGQTYRLGVRFYNGSVSVDSTKENTSIYPFFGFVI